MLGLSKSTFYFGLSAVKIDRDKADRVRISKIFFERKEKVGSGQIKMLIQRQEGEVLSRKKIVRIMKKSGLITKIRRTNEYRKFAKRQHEHKS